MRMIVIVTVVLLIGCSKPPGSEGVSTQTQVNDPSYVPIAIESQGTSFGLLNAYSGTLSDEQNDTVHTALHGAYIVEATSKITAKALKKELESKELVAEEQHDGHRCDRTSSA